MSTPICRCRVLYLGSAVPHITKDGLQGIQEPLRELYPDEGILGARGIDSWLSVWSNGLLLENIDELGKRLTRFFPVETLHYCAAVRHVVVPGRDGERIQRFLPLDSPFARVPNATNPPLFACILRRTTGIKVLECHAFICKKEIAAYALVRCCFHAYADNMRARQIETKPNGNGTINSNGNWRANHRADSPTRENGQQNGENGENGDLISIYDENHKVWGGSASSSSPSPEVKQLYSDTGTNTTFQSIKSSNSQKAPRLRQMILPSKPPPPVEILPSNENKREAKQKKASTNGHGPPRGTPVPGPHLIPHPEARRYRGGGGGTPVYGFPPHPPAIVGTNGRPLPPYILVNSAEEPTYMPSNRPLSPVASYQPAAFPYDRYYMHQYNGTIQPQPQKQQKKKRKNEKNSDSESKYSTGIYRKKGHLNERAFSYSIRQEHRSRSHSSLSAIAFNGNSTPKHSSDKELAQMVTEISLTDDGSDEGDSRHRIPNKSTKTNKVGR